MKYTPKPLTGNVNVSPRHPLAELAWMLFGLLVLVLTVFVFFWVLSEWTVTRVPVEVELGLGKQLSKRFDMREDAALSQRLAEIVQHLPPDSPLRRYSFKVGLIANKEVNAIALPGGHIGVFTGLLQQIRSQNELDMILAHELGHYAHRDHLRGLGRGLGATLALAMLLGADSQAARMASNALLGMEMRYSQQQEAAADDFALDALVRRYGHAGGATDFFVRLAQKSGDAWGYVLASHPHPQARIMRLEAQIAQKQYPLRPTLPYAPAAGVQEKKGGP